MSDIIEMDAYEYQTFYDRGLMPERFWPEEIAVLRNKFARDDISLGEFEDSLDEMMGLGTWSRKP